LIALVIAKDVKMEIVKTANAQIVAVKIVAVKNDH